MSSKKPSRKGWEVGSKAVSDGVKTTRSEPDARDNEDYSGSESAVNSGGYAIKSVAKAAVKGKGKKGSNSSGKGKSNTKPKRSRKNGKDNADGYDTNAVKKSSGDYDSKKASRKRVRSSAGKEYSAGKEGSNSTQKFGFQGRGSDKESRKNAKGRGKNRQKPGSAKFDFKKGKSGTEGMTKSEKDAQKAEFKLEKTTEKKEKVQKKLNRTRKNAIRVSIDRRFDEKDGKGKYEFRLAKEKVERPERESLKKKASRKVYFFTKDYIHQKVSENERENASVEGYHKAEKKAEDAFSYFWGKRKSKQEKLEGRFSKLERKEARLAADFQYKKYLADNPEMQKKIVQKHLQKLRIKREYAKAARIASGTDVAAVAQQSMQRTTIIARKIQEVIRKVASSVGSIGVLLIFFLIIMAMIGTFSVMIASSLSTQMAGSYQSLPAEMDAADAAFTELEANLQQQINRVEEDHPGYDEYEYNLGEIGHDPFALMNYLSAKYTDFTAAGVSGDITELFNRMYSLSFHEREETRTSRGDDGEEHEYTVTILETRLVVTPLEDIVTGMLSPDEMNVYRALLETKGALQDFYSPLDLYWYNYISSYYGQRVHPITGDLQMHRGLDIAVPEGTNLYAAHDGRIAETGDDADFGKYIVIEDDRGYTTKYGHLSEISVNVGDAVLHGDEIGKTGNTGASTGSHLHLELLYEGEYYNPLFYFLTGDDTLFGEEASGTRPGGGIDMSDREPFDDETVEALISEAERYLGMPYTFGGTPPRSFDCSAFVCWVFSNSGVHDLPRTTAQGIYDQCGSVSRDEARPGDIIFFTGTYDAGRPVTHVGIYVGDGKMIHCGDPIKYASINTPYWQSHFYGFGRLE